MVNTPRDNGTDAGCDVPFVERLRRHFEQQGRIRRGILLFNTGRFAEAARLFASVKGSGFRVQGSGSGEDGGAVVREALAWWRSGDRARAIETLREAMKAEPASAEIHFQLGTLLAAGEEMELAELHFTQATTLDAGHVEALTSLGLLCGASNRSAEAVRYLRRAQRLRPWSARIGLWLSLAAKAAREQGEVIALQADMPSWETADEVLTEEMANLLERDMELVEVFFEEGGAERELSVFLAAVLERLQTRLPGNARVPYYRSRVLQRLGRRAEAIRAGERAVETDPRHAQGLIQLARLYLETDRKEAARERLEQAIALGVEYADVYYLLGNLYREMGKTPAARRAYEQALGINAGYEAAWEALRTLAA